MNYKVDMSIKEYVRLNFTDIIGYFDKVMLINEDCPILKEDIVYHKWCYVTSLRGPDKGFGNVTKALFNGFLRGYSVYAYGINDFYSIIHNLAQQDKCIIERLKKDLQGKTSPIFLEDSHYLSHIYHGLQSIDQIFDGEIRIITDILKDLLMVDCKSMIPSSSVFKRLKEYDSFVIEHFLTNPDNVKIFETIKNIMKKSLI